MADYPNGNGFSRWITRAGLLLDVAGRVTLATFLLAIVVVGGIVYFGYLRSPYSDVPASILRLETRIADTNLERAKLDKQLIDTILQMKTDMARNSIAYRIRVCSDIKDLPLRTRCLES